jgi:Toprim domain
VVTHIACGDGDVVAWCAGHILETAAPQAYGAEYKHWRLGDLPIIPRDWKLDVSAPELLKSIKTLLKRATRVVHAGDPDREGQLLVDEVLRLGDIVSLATKPDAPVSPVDRLIADVAGRCHGVYELKPDPAPTLSAQLAACVTSNALASPRPPVRTGGPLRPTCWRNSNCGTEARRPGIGC